MCFGLVIGNMKQQGQALRDFFDCLNEAIMRLVAIIIWSVKTHPSLHELPTLDFYFSPVCRNQIERFACNFGPTKGLFESLIKNKIYFMFIAKDGLSKFTVPTFQTLKPLTVASQIFVKPLYRFNSEFWEFWMSIASRSVSASYTQLSHLSGMLQWASCS